jgi:MGT family glycosyltransferase
VNFPIAKSFRRLRTQQLRKTIQRLQAARGLVFEENDGAHPERCILWRVMDSGDRQGFVLFAVIPAIGHINPLLQLAREAQRRGWRVALATTEERRGHVKATAPEIPFVSLGTVSAELQKRIDEETLHASAAANMLTATLRSTKVLVDGFWPLLFDRLVEAIRADRPDFMVIDNATLAALDAAELESVPFAVNNPDLLSFLPYTLMPFEPDIPLAFSGGSIHALTPMRRKLQRRLWPLIRIAADLVLRDFNKRQNACRRSRGMPATDYRYRLKGKLVITNCAFGLEHKRELPETIQMVGPLLPSEIEPLSAEYGDWLSNGPAVVYVNLGTIALPPPEQMRKMMDAFRDQPYRVLWILREEQHRLLKRFDIPSNVRVESWGPSPRAVLSHPAVGVFVSHCGINSVHESLQAGTPIVGIPMFADQPDMAMRVQDAGVGLALNKIRFTAEQLRDAVRRVMHEPKFRLRIPEIQQSFRDAGGVQRAADLIEREALRQL